MFLELAWIKYYEVEDWLISAKKEKEKLEDRGVHFGQPNKFSFKIWGIALEQAT